MIKGNIHRYGDNIDTDVIIPARYCTAFTEAELAPHCLEDLDAQFVKKVKKGDLIVAGRNFGCGSSRENAPIAIRGRRLCVIATSRGSSTATRSASVSDLRMWRGGGCEGHSRDARRSRNGRDREPDPE